MANPLPLILAAGAAVIVFGKKKKKKTKPAPVEEAGPLFPEETEPEETEPAPEVPKIKLVAKKVEPTIKVAKLALPTWTDENETKALQIMKQEFEGKQLEGPITFFRLAKKAANQVWPGQPWPQKVSDEEPVEVGLGVYQNKWIVDAGPMGPLLNSIWSKLIGLAWDVTGYIAP